MKKISFFAAMAALCILCGCAASKEPDTLPTLFQPSLPTASPSPTPSPTPSPAPTPVSVVLKDESPEEILALADYSDLREVDGTGSREYDALLSLSTLLPDCHVFWNCPIDGRMVPSDAQELTLSSTAGLIEALPYLPELKDVDLFACSPSNEEMELCYTLRPDVEFHWMVSFGKWSVESDITCFSALSTDLYYTRRYTSEEFYPLFRFCRHLRALDLGHSDLTDLSALTNLKELQVLILADNPNITDISPLGELTELYYLELFVNSKIKDFTPLSKLVKMMDINLSYCTHLQDISFIDNMPELQNAWFRNTHVSRQDIAVYSEMRPDAVFLVGRFPDEPSSTAFGWHSTDRNKAIRHAFTYWREVETFFSWDNVIYKEEGS